MSDMLSWVPPFASKCPELARKPCPQILDFLNRDVPLFLQKKRENEGRRTDLIWLILG